MAGSDNRSSKQRKQKGFGVLFQNRVARVLEFAEREWPAKSVKARYAAAWQRMLDARRDFEAGPTEDEVEKFRAMPWYPMSWSLYSLLGSVRVAIVMLMRATSADSQARRRDLDTIGNLFRSVIESDSFHQFRQWFPVPYRPALFVILCHLENAFENMLHVAENVEMDDPAFVRAVGIDMHAAMSMFFKLVEYEPIAEDSPPDETGLRFLDDRLVLWNGKPVDLHPLQRKVLRVLWDHRKDTYVPYAALEKARDMPIQGEVTLHTARGLRSVINRINTGLRAVACPHVVKRPKGCPGYRLMLHENIIGSKANR